MKKIEAVIFDMDGTIIDSMPAHLRSWKEFMQRNGVEMSDEAFAAINHGTLYDIMPRIFGAGISKQDAYRRGMEKEALYREMYGPDIRPLDGLLSFIQHLKEQQIKIGLATAADHTNVDFTIDALGLQQAFDVIVTSDEIPEGKPSPAVYVEAARQLNVAPDRCFVFEDTPTGLEAAKRAGMHYAAIATGLSAAQLRQYEPAIILADYTSVNIVLLQNLLGAA